MKVALFDKINTALELFTGAIIGTEPLLLGFVIVMPPPVKNNLPALSVMVSFKSTVPFSIWVPIPLLLNPNPLLVTGVPGPFWMMPEKTLVLVLLTKYHLLILPLS